MQMPRLLRNSASILVAGLMLAGIGAAAQAQETTGSDGDENTITIGYVNWTEAVAVTHLMQAILENKFNYEVELILVGVEEAFKGVASGRLDAFLDVWLPQTHGNYWQEYSDQVVDLGVWYHGKATLGLAVPNYVKAQSISDLKGRAQVFDGKILGIQPGAGLMRVTSKKAIPTYGLGAYDLVPGKTSLLVEKIDKAIRNREPIVYTAWKPHWLFSAYPVRYLDDPKGVYDQVDRIHAIARQGLKADAPTAYALLNSFSLTEEQLGSLELTIANSRSAWGGVRRWLATHQDVIAPWLAAAGTKRSDYLK